MATTLLRARSARRRRARRTVGEYRAQQLAALLERIREGLARSDCGEIDVFELDELIERHQRAARKLWVFSGSTGSEWERAADALHSCAGCIIGPSGST